MASQETEIGELDITDELIAERRAEEPGQTPEDMTPWQRPITAFIDVLNLWAGRILCVLLVPLIAVMVFEVFSRSMFGVLNANDMGDLARAWGLLMQLCIYCFISLRCCSSSGLLWNMRSTRWVSKG